MKGHAHQFVVRTDGAVEALADLHLDGNPQRPPALNSKIGVGHLRLTLQTQMLSFYIIFLNEATLLLRESHWAEPVCIYGSVDRTEEACVTPVVIVPISVAWSLHQMECATIDVLCPRDCVRCIIAQHLATLPGEDQLLLLLPDDYNSPIHLVDLVFDPEILRYPLYWC
jgi:hypothetical protein